jgi:CTP synthase (UTP-ammonia lyase)
VPDAVYGEAGGTPAITLLACSLMDQRIQIELTPGTRLAVLYGGAATAEERTTCNYGLEPSLKHLASSHGMRVSAVDNTGEVRAIERADHPSLWARCTSRSCARSRAHRTLSLRGC